MKGGGGNRRLVPVTRSAGREGWFAVVDRGIWVPLDSPLAGASRRQRIGGCSCHAELQTSYSRGRRGGGRRLLRPTLPTCVLTSLRRREIEEVSCDLPGMLSEPSREAFHS